MNWLIVNVLYGMNTHLHLAKNFILFINQNENKVSSAQKLPQPKISHGTKILEEIIITLITNLKFQHKPKYHLSKMLIQKLSLNPKS
jgi:hypothetical protein